VLPLPPPVVLPMDPGWQATRITKIYRPQKTDSKMISWVSVVIKKEEKPANTEENTKEKPKNTNANAKLKRENTDVNKKEKPTVVNYHNHQLFLL
jgi:hypothetical protein